MARTDWTCVLEEGVPLIVNECRQIGGPMTVRRAFYLLVSARLISNNRGQYQQLSDKLARAREEDILPWECIHDESRNMIIPLSWDDVDAWAEVPDPESFMYDPTPEQENYVEVWVEKAGNIPILRPVCDKYHVRLVSTGGRTSVTYKHYAARRFRYWSHREKPCVILYVSDLDADGEHFPVETRQYLEDKESVLVDVRKIVLTHEQVTEHSLPVLSKSYSTSRNKGYLQDFLNRHGPIQVEIDALPFRIMRTTVEAELDQLLSPETIDEVREKSVEDARLAIGRAVQAYLGGDA